MQLCRIIISSDIFAYHQEHLNSIIAYVITHVCRCQLVVWECWNSSNTPMIPCCFRLVCRMAATWVNTTRYCKYSSAPDDGQNIVRKI